jgi:hypothetical protein
MICTLANSNLFAIRFRAGEEIVVENPKYHSFGPLCLLAPACRMYALPPPNKVLQITTQQAFRVRVVTGLGKCSRIETVAKVC